MICNLIVVTGQTATGKTKLAYKLAKKHKGEIINCDSRQIYKKLDIITGKHVFPDIKTHLLDIIDPKERFSSFDYVGLANSLIKKLLDKDATPIMVGGSYLYLKHLLYGIDVQTPADWKLREKLGKKSVPQLQKMLKQLDSQSFERLNQSDRNNPHRLIRKIEIALRHPGANEVSDRILTLDSIDHAQRSFQNDKISHRHSRAGGNLSLLDPRFHGDDTRKLNNDNLSFKFIGLRFKSKENLKKTIEKRVEQRIRDGAFQEVKHLIKQGYSLKDPGLNTFGYKQIMNYYAGKISKEKAVEEWVNKEVQYAKRQLTFMKKDKNINWTTV